jgi:hypothetical protein
MQILWKAFQSAGNCSNGIWLERQSSINRSSSSVTAFLYCDIGQCDAAISARAAGLRRLDFDIDERRPVIASWQFVHRIPQDLDQVEERLAVEPCHAFCDLLVHLGQLDQLGQQPLDGHRVILDLVDDRRVLLAEDQAQIQVEGAQVRRQVGQPQVLVIPTFQLRDAALAAPDPVGDVLLRQSFRAPQCKQMLDQPSIVHSAVEIGRELLVFRDIADHRSDARVPSALFGHRQTFLQMQDVVHR